MGLLSNRSQRTSKRGKNVSDTLACGLSATSLFLPHFDVICDLLGTLSRDDDYSSENVGKKMNLRSFRLKHVYQDPSICKMQAPFPGVEFLRILFRCKKRKENSSAYVHVPHKTFN